MSSSRSRDAATPPLEGEQLLNNQLARLETLAHYLSRKNQAAVHEFIDEELRMLRAMAVVAHAATNDPSMQLIRAMSTALRALHEGPPLVGVVQSKRVKDLQLRAARARTAGATQDPKLIAQLHKAALEQNKADRKKGVRRGPRDELVHAANTICMLVGAPRDAVPFKDSRSVVRQSLIAVAKEAWSRDHVGASGSNRQDWINFWLAELRAGGAPACTVQRARVAYQGWLATSHSRPREENAAIETLFRIGEFLDEPATVQKSAKAVAKALCERAENPGTDNAREWTTEEAAEALERVVQRVVFGELRERARNTSRVLERRSKRQGRDVGG